MVTQKALVTMVTQYLVTMVTHNAWLPLFLTMFDYHGYSQYLVTMVTILG